MRRREFITLLGGAAAWPLAARAQQQPTMALVGFLGTQSADQVEDQLRALRQGLSEIGYIDGRNLAIDYRSADGQNDRLPTMAADFVRRQVSAIIPWGLPATLAAKAATATIPIVFLGGFDPVARGVIASLNRPGGNITGVTELGIELGRKRLELLHELIPTMTSVALLVNPTNPITETTTTTIQAAARTLGLQWHVVHASTEREIDSAFATLVKLGAGGLVIGGDVLFLGGGGERIAALAIRHRVPTISQFRDFAAAGGLISYGGDVIDQFRRVGIYTGRVLKGEKPADLPVQQSTKFELFINLKTARAFGLEVPPALLVRADEVIE
jgi:putative tryptophan/tyrosine transport system substrate-binding protein